MFLVLAIIGTTLVSWFNLNSLLIIALVVCRLSAGGRPQEAIRRAFANRFFLAYFSIFLIEALGMLYTHDAYTAYKHVESKATLVALPFVFCSGEVLDRKGFRQLLWGYCWLLAMLCLYCLVVAAVQFISERDWDIFFYHRLTEPLGINAVFFSGYILIAQLFLLSGASTGRGRPVLLLFFAVVMILLSSRIMLVLQVIVFLVYLRGRVDLQLRSRQFAGLAALVIVGTGGLAVTNNPVGERYHAIMHNNLQYAGRHSVPPHAEFNGISLRLLMWQFAGEILNENKAWVIGVSSGDSQDLLNRKYLAANMSKGFLSYNFHNQYIEILVRSGVAGLCLFLAAMALLAELAWRTSTKEGWFLLVMLILLSMTESTLEMQHSLFLFSFFPLLFAIPTSDFARDSWKRRGEHESSLSGMPG